MTDNGRPEITTTQYTTRAPGQVHDTASTRTPQGSAVNAAPSSSNWGIVIGTVAVVAVVALAAWALLGSDSDAPLAVPATPAVTAPAAEPVTPAPQAVTPAPEAVTPAPESGTVAPQTQPVTPAPAAQPATGN